MNKTRYTITVEKSEVIETVTNRQWVQGGTEGVSEGASHGYTPQIPMVATETVTVVNMKLSELKVDELVAAILQCGKVC